MRHIKSSFLIILLYIIFVFGSITAGAASDNEAETIRVILPDYSRLLDIDKDGAYVGYGYEYLKEISKYTHWNYEFITDVSYTKGIDMINRGEADLIGPIVKSAYLEKLLDFPEYSVGYQYNILASLDGFTYENIIASDNIKIGIVIGSNGSSEIDSFCKNINISSYKSILFNSFDEMMEALKSGALDCVFINNFTYIEELEAISVSDEPLQQFFAAPKGKSELIKQINKAIGAIKINKPEFQSRLQEKYDANISIKAFHMSDRERQYLKNLKSITLNIDTDSPPFTYYNSKNELCGVNIDIINYIKNTLKIDVSYIIDENYTIKSDSNEPVLNILCVDDAVWSQKNSVYVTSPYQTSNVSVIMNNSVSDYSDNTLHAAYVENTYIGYNYVKENGYTKKTAYNTFLDCIKAVDKGEADVTFTATQVADCADRIGYLRNSTAVTVSNVPLYFGLSVSRNADYTLYSILNSLMESIPDSYVQNSINTHLSYFNDKMYLSTYIYKNPIQAIIIIIILLVIFFIILILLCKNKAERKRHELQLEKCRLEEADRAKNEFFSKMSHEMRTPLNAIIGISALLEANKTNPEKVVDSSNKIQYSAQHLLQIINDILDINKMTSKNTSLNLAPFDIYNMIDTIYAIYKEYARQNGISFELKTDECIPKYLIGDELRIKQIIINLLSNAIKYNKENGKIVLSAALTEKTDDYARIYFSVEDTGIGISSENIENIFNQFERAKEVASKEGTGLGLPIVKDLIELMGSKIIVDSIPNKGSCFSFELKLEIDKNNDTVESRETDIEAYSLENKHYLLVEDNYLNQELTKDLLTLENAYVDIASNGREGVDIFNLSAPGYYDAVLMDLYMPFMDGYEASKAIRSLDREDALSIPIIGVSANTLESDKNKALESGMSNYITKPIDIRTFRQMLAKLNK